MNPLSQKATSVIDFVSNELYFDLFVHIDFGIFDETAHEYIGPLNFHKISAIGPAYSFLFDLISEPVIFLLEGQVFDF